MTLFKFMFCVYSFDSYTCHKTLGVTYPCIQWDIYFHLGRIHILRCYPYTHHYHRLIAYHCDSSCLKQIEEIDDQVIRLLVIVMRSFIKIKQRVLWIWNLFGSINWNIVIIQTTGFGFIWRTVCTVNAICDTITFNIRRETRIIQTTEPIADIWITYRMSRVHYSYVLTFAIFISNSSNYLLTHNP